MKQTLVLIGVLFLQTLALANQVIPLSDTGVRYAVVAAKISKGLGDQEQKFAYKVTVSKKVTGCTEAQLSVVRLSSSEYEDTLQANASLTTPAIGNCSHQEQTISKSFYFSAGASYLTLQVPEESGLEIKIERMTN